MPKKILLVEDEKDVAQIMRKRIQSAGYETFVAHNGKEGLDLARRVHPHLILTDLVMPVMDGFELFNELKKGKDTAHIPVIIASAHGRHQPEMLEAGAKDFLTKPFDMPTVLDHIGTFFHGQRAFRIIIATKMFFLMQAILEDAKDIAERLNIHLTNDQANLLAEAAALVPDVIILDVDMFIGQHASDVVKALRELPALKETRILLIRSLLVNGVDMATDQQADVARCLENGASHFIGNLNKESFLHVMQEYCG